MLMTFEDGLSRPVASGRHVVVHTLSLTEGAFGLVPQQFEEFGHLGERIEVILRHLPAHQRAEGCVMSERGGGAIGQSVGGRRGGRTQCVLTRGGRNTTSVTTS